MYINKLPNAAASVITVTSTATSLESLIATASGTTFDMDGRLNAVDIHPEDGDIRVLVDGNTPTGSNGLLLKSGGFYQLRGVPLTKMLLIRTSGNVSCSVQIGRSEIHESGSAALPASIGSITVDSEFPAAAALTDNFANPTTTVGGSMLMVWDGATWDRAPGSSADGLTVNLGSNNDVVAAGDVAHDAADSGNPVKTGGVARSTNPTAVGDGDRVNSFHDDVGRIVTQPVQARDLIDTQATTITSSTAETTIVTAGGAGVFLDLISIVITNTSATATEVSLRDATSGTVIAVISAPSEDSRGVSWAVPVPQATANNNWTAQCADSVASIEIMAQYAKNV